MKTKSEFELDRIIKKIKQIEKQRPSHKEILDFAKEIIREQYKIKPLIKIEPISMDKETAKKHTLGGFTLLDKKALKIDLKLAKTLFKNICKALREKNEKIAPWIRIINKSMRSKEINIEEVFNKFIAGDKNYLDAICKKIGISTLLFTFLIENSLKPFFEAYSESIKDIFDQDSWFKNTCPICGSEPFMGEIRDVEELKLESGRFLICSLCGFHWRYIRLACPYCGKGKPEKARLFTTDADGKAYRIEVCDECKKYIKTVDTKIAGKDFMPLVADFATLHLDIIAKNEGYKRGLPGIIEMEQEAE